MTVTVSNLLSTSVAITVLVYGHKHRVDYTVLYTSSDENHLCGASLRENHKISLKAHRHTRAHGVGTPTATCRSEKLPRQ